MTTSMSVRRRAARRATRWGAVAATLLAVGLTVPANAAGGASSDCPDGLHAGDPSQATIQAELSCTDLSGADLSGAQMGQATLTGSDLHGADLSHADLTQADLVGVDLRGANLTDADLTQADLTDADLRGATVSGANTTQATLDGTNFDDVRGLKPYATYILVIAVVVFVLLAGIGLLRASRKRRPAAPAMAPTAYSPPPSPETAPFGALAIGGGPSSGLATACALGGALITAAGVHLFLGGLINTFSFGFDTLATICQQPTCAVGIDTGVVGLVAGVPVALGGLAVWGRS